MKKTILAIAAFLALPAASFAATYHYVDQSGMVRTIQADNAAQAEAMATDKAPNSGVTLDTGVLDSGDTVLGTSSSANAGNDTYFYVDQNSIVRATYADNASEAIATAPNIAVHSGVIMADSQIDTGESVAAQAQ